jgi:hypothetical protein
VEFCQIAEKIAGLQQEKIPFLVESQFSPLTEAYKDPGRRIIGKKYITDADASKAGACQKCLEHANRIFKWPQEAHLMPKLPLHPNCKCHYEDVYEYDLVYEKSIVKKALAEVLKFIPSKMQNITEEFVSTIYQWATAIETKKLTVESLVKKSLSALFIKMDTGVAKYNVKGEDLRLKIHGRTIDGYDDLINHLKKRYKPARKLIIINHGASSGTMTLGNGPSLDSLTDKQISKLREYLSKDCIVYMRACKDAKGAEAQKKYQRFAKRIKRLVVAYQGFVSPWGDTPPPVQKMQTKIQDAFFVSGFLNHIRLFFHLIKKICIL